MYICTSSTWLRSIGKFLSVSSPMAAIFLCSAKHGSVLHIVYYNPPPSQPIIIFKADGREEKSWWDKVSVQVTRRRKQELVGPGECAGHKAALASWHTFPPGSSRTCRGCGYRD